MDISKMMINWILTMNDKHAQSEHENTLQNHAIIHQTF